MTRIGQYHIKGIISSGGMATVYEALQEHTGRTVAVKVMKEGIASESTLRRFEYEAEILAKLDHPHIARVIETGTRDHGGEPFIVMEYVEGARPIIGYAREEALPLEVCLELFTRVCEAIHHGHQKGILHRDLKPSNILVDAAGRVKIIDFGVARALDSDVALTTLHTATGELLGTLQYMSPEQCAADPLDLDVRSDVYALGVVLYELICGQLPYDVQREDLVKAANTIREDPPDRPSSINRSLRGDAETIVLKALEKERERRYQTVADLASDIQRHLKGEVILAKPAGFITRTLKLIKRRPAKSAAVGVAAIAVLVYAVMNLWYLVRMTGERDRAFMAETNALAAWDEAKEQANLAEARFEEIIRLSDAKLLSQLEAEADELWPAYPDKASPMEAWLAEAKELSLRLPAHRETLGDWSDFEEGSDEAWAFDSLTELVKNMESFCDEEKGTLENVRKRLAFARTVHRESIEDRRDEWNRAIASISNVEESPRYGGLDIEPQIGLVPVGRDPRSRLWEFALLQTGKVPERGPDGTLLLDEETGLVFVLLPGGTFSMGAVPPGAGCPPGDPNVDPFAYPGEGPVREKKVNPFFLSKHEMTQGQWMRFKNENPSTYGPGWSSSNKTQILLHPVESVSCLVFEHTLYRLNLRLPSEEEWEYAARAGTRTVWWTGNERESLEGAANLMDRACRKLGGGLEKILEPWLDDGYTVHAPVGTFRPNAFGLHDVCGNVWEWCYPRGYPAARMNEEALDPENPPSRVVRGSSFHSNAEFARSAYGGELDPRYQGFDYGARPALSLRRRAKE